MHSPNLISHLIEALSTVIDHATLHRAPDSHAHENVPCVVGVTPHDWNELQEAFHALKSAAAIPVETPAAAPLHPLVRLSNGCWVDPGTIKAICPELEQTESGFRVAREPRFLVNTDKMTIGVICKDDADLAEQVQQLADDVQAAVREGQRVSVLTAMAGNNTPPPSPRPPKGTLHMEEGSGQIILRGGYTNSSDLRSLSHDETGDIACCLVRGGWNVCRTPE
jgi:hypothetical protein